MNRQQALSLLPIIEAYAAGKRIQVKQDVLASLMLKAIMEKD